MCHESSCCCKGQLEASVVKTAVGAVGAPYCKRRSDYAGSQLSFAAATASMKPGLHPLTGIHGYMWIYGHMFGNISI
jgi:hypothetical protein